MEKYLIIGKWYIRILEKGDAYGNNDCLVWGDTLSGVEFYDYSQNKETFGFRGQFVSRYFASIMMSDAMLRYYGRSQGFDIYGVPSWRVSIKEMRVIIKFIEEFANIK